ncbi:hypothetical protein ACFQ0B_76405 [Nonomuraea thailandensis]
MIPSQDRDDFDPIAAAQQILDLSNTAGPEPPPQRRAEQLTIVGSEGLLPDSLTDRGNAKLFVHLYGRDFRHVPGMGWFRWAQHRWVLDESDAVMWSAGEMAEQLAVFDPRGRYSSAELRRHRRRALSTTGMHALLAQAKAAPGMVLEAARLDADPYALCTPAGVVDLRVGTIMAPDPLKQPHSRSTTVSPAVGYTSMATIPTGHVRR